MLLQAVEEEEKQEAERKGQEEEEKQWRVEAAIAAEKEYWEQGWRMDESLEEFRWHQQREEKQKEVDMEDLGRIGCIQP